MTKLQLELAAIDRLVADGAEVGGLSMGSHYVTVAELAEIRRVNGEPGGTVDCYGCAYRMAATRTRCPKCNMYIRLDDEAPPRDARIDEHTERISEGLAAVRAAAAADRLAKAKAVGLGPTPLEVARKSGFKRGSREFNRAYGRAWRQINPKTPNEIAASNAKARAKRAASKRAK